MYSLLSVLRRWAPILLYGLAQTFKISICAIGIALLLGVLIGVFTCNKMRVAMVSRMLDVYTFCTRCIPFYTQLLIMYFTVPYALGIALNPEQASIIALGLCSAGYVGEIIRGGINALSSGQWLAAKAVGYSPYTTLRYIILPQAVAHVIPALANECIQVVHATSVLSAIGTPELTKVASNIIAREMNPLIIYPLIAALYLLITGAITFLLRRVEERGRYVNR